MLLGTFYVLFCGFPFLCGRRNNLYKKYTEKHDYCREGETRNPLRDVGENLEEKR